MRALLTDFQGFAVFLTEEAWNHIVLPPHDYMKEMPESVYETVQGPDDVRRSNTRPETVRLYYRWFTDTAVGDKWVCVVVKCLEGEAYILTAYATDQIRAGDSYP